MSYFGCGKQLTDQSEIKPKELQNPEKLSEQSSIKQPQLDQNSLDRDSSEQSVNNNNNNQNNNWISKSFKISNNKGTFVFNIPENWVITTEENKTNEVGLLTVIIENPDKNFKILATILDKSSELSEAKTFIKETGEELALASVEKNFTLEELNGKQAKGYYHGFLTDKKFEINEPPNGEYKYISSAIIVIDQLSIWATTFSNSKDQKLIEQGLETLKKIEHHKI